MTKGLSFKTRKDAYGQGVAVNAVIGTLGLSSSPNCDWILVSRGRSYVEVFEPAKTPEMHMERKNTVQSETS